MVERWTKCYFFREDSKIPFSFRAILLFLYPNKPSEHIRNFIQLSYEIRHFIYDTQILNACYQF